MPNIDLWSLAKFGILLVLITGIVCALLAGIVGVLDLMGTARESMQTMVSSSADFAESSDGGSGGLYPVSWSLMLAIPTWGLSDVMGAYDLISGVVWALVALFLSVVLYYTLREVIRTSGS